MPLKEFYTGETIVGTMIRMVHNPAVALVARQTGLDFIMLDMEHGPYTYHDLGNIAAASAGAGLGCFVRVPALGRDHVSRALDCGADGIMVPMIESIEQARRLAAWAKYPPMGGRGLGTMGGHTGYGQVNAVADFMRKANAETLAIAQIETAAGVDAVDDIAAIEGIDVLLVGPFDLSVSLGAPGDFTCPAMVGAIERVAAAAVRQGKVFGMHAGDSLLRRWIPNGMRFIMSDLDISMLSAGMQAIYDRYKKPAVIMKPA